MKWFYKLSRRVRNIITGVLWGVTAVATVVVGVVYGGDTENAHPAVAVVVVAFLTAAIVFTVFASKATAREKAAAKPQEEKHTTQPAAAAKNDMPAWVYAPVESESDGAVGVGFTARIRNGVTFPIRTKAVGVTFGDHQDNIAASVVGDVLIIKHAPFGQYSESTDIINARTGKRVGHVKKELALSLLDEFDVGFVLDGEITDITGGTADAPTRGCNIVIDGVRK